MLEYYFTLVALVAGLPVALSCVPSSQRSTGFYLYLALLFFSLSLWGTLITFPLSASITTSAATLAYTSILFTAVIFLIIENDIHVLRNIIRLIMFIAVVRFLIIILLSNADQFETITSTFGLPDDIAPFFAFTILLGSILTSSALVLLFSLFRYINARSSKHHLLSFYYSLCFFVVLTLVSVISQLMISPITPNMLQLIAENLQAEFVLSLFTSSAFFLFLLIFKDKVTKFHSQPFALRNMIMPSKKERQLEAKTSSFSLQQSKVMYQELTESIKDIFFSLDKNLIVTYWNKAAESTGITQEQAIGRSILDLFPNTDENGEEYYYKQVIHSQQEVDFVIKRVNQYNQLIYKKIRAYPSLSGLSVLTSDITEQMQIEKEQKQLEEQLQHAHKMDALGTLAGGIAHDFNNILAVIKGYTELCLLEVAQNSSLQEKLDRVNMASGRAEELVKQILTFSRMGSSDKSIIKPTSVIHEAVSFLRPIISANIDIKASIEDEQVLIEADGNQLHQVFINLGTNAYHAMEEKGGTLEFLTQTINFADAPLAQNPDRNAPYKYCLKISIKDTGIGIPAEIKDKILDPFYTTKKSDKGTGLGLSIVDRIVSRHHGKIIISSEPGQGTCIALYFPILNKTELKIAHNNKSLKTPVRGSGHILLVEDEAPLLTLYQSYLQTLGYTVTACKTAESGLEQFLSSDKRFTLIFTNLNLPGISGLELATQIHQVNPQIPVVLSSGNDHQLNQHAINTDIKEYLVKPISLETLGETLALYQHTDSKDGYCEQNHEINRPSW